MSVQDQALPNSSGLAQICSAWDAAANYTRDNTRSPQGYQVTYNNGLYNLTGTPTMGIPPGTDAAWTLVADIGGPGPGGGIGSINGNELTAQTIVGTGLTTVTSTGGVTTVATPAPASLTSINGDTTTAQLIVGSGAATVTSSGGTTTISVPAGADGVTSVNGNENAAQLIVGSGGTTVTSSGGTTTVASANALLSINGNTTQAQTIQGGGIASVISNSGVTTVLVNAIQSINGNTAAAQTIVGAGATSVSSASGVTTITSSAGVTTLGTYDSVSPTNNGASISGNTLSNQSATILSPGMVSTGAQSFAGAKTFQDGVIGNLTGNADTSTSSTTATNLAGGAANRIAVQSASGATTFIAAPVTNNTFLAYVGSSLGWVSSPADGVASINGDATPDQFISGSGIISTATVSGVTTISANTSALAPIASPTFTGTVTAPTFVGALTGTASGNTTYTANNHGVVLSSATNVMTVVAPVSNTGYVLTSNGLSSDPTWQAPAARITSINADTAAAQLITGSGIISANTVSGTTTISADISSLATIAQLQNGTFDAVFDSLSAAAFGVGESGVSNGLIALVNNNVANPIDFILQGGGGTGNAAYIWARYNVSEQNSWINFPRYLSDGVTLARPCIGNSYFAADQIATLGDIQAATNTTFTPTDGSGASLTFTGVVANYSRVGNLINASILATYPTTASGSNAAIGSLPAVSSSNQVVPVFSSGFAGGLLGVVDVGTSIVFLYHADTGVAVTNVELTGAQVMLSLTYPV